jgi:hypothetical protein
MPVSETSCVSQYYALNIAYKRLAKLQLPLYTYLRLRGKQTNGGGSGWSIEGRKKWWIVYGSQGWQKTKCQAVQSTAPSFFQARRRRKQLAKHNAKDDARPKAKVAYHRMNELEDEDSDSDEEDSANEKAALSDNDNNSDSDNYNVHCPMNVIAL